ncbi:cbb3-type cytochrome c oxidase N-terminal domain-containing protein [Pseudotamlana carrageenivorans]|uniref:Cytochrome C oxidase subunit III n=1 Tax=Pseudotamlana carrageenivorans TaxID=2069432 RepID=A0A2I7SJJ8_9FLAO|nr:cbb3-type cytochrome c oxidase N-terminal domain-containing protein [Tamlana carrageenivorans]AUS06071.1 cytochrome C oxidase subunit III [Tamlana carrageenivorans]
MRNLIPSWIRVPILFFIVAGIVEFFVDSGNQPAFIKYPAVLMFLLLVLFILIAIEGIVGSLENVMFQKLDPEAQARFLADKEKATEFPWLKKTYLKLLGSKPIEQEGEIILDHNYDGIKELDNDLPPWWKYAFIISIIFAAIYLLRYEVFSGPSQIEEFDTELAEAKIAIEAYKKTAKGLVDVNTVTVLTETADLTAGKTIFETNCVACHMADGGGGIGPNLTDNHWILGGDIKSIFHTVSEGGRAGKGMIAWKAQLKPLEIAQVASYVLTFQGTTPANPKAPEGDIIINETTEAAEAVTDTTETASPELKDESVSEPE